MSLNYGTKTNMIWNRMGIESRVLSSRSNGLSSTRFWDDSDYR